MKTERRERLAQRGMDAPEVVQRRGFARTVAGALEDLPRLLEDRESVPQPPGRVVEETQVVEDGACERGRTGLAAQGQRGLEVGAGLLSLSLSPVDQPDLIERRRLTGLVSLLLLEIESLAQILQRSGGIAHEAPDVAGLIKDLGLAGLVTERPPAFECRVIGLEGLLERFLRPLL